MAVVTKAIPFKSKVLTMPSGLMGANGKRIGAAVHKGVVSLIPRRMEVTVVTREDGEVFVGIGMKLRKPAALLVGSRVVALEIDSFPVADGQIGLSLDQANALVVQLVEALTQLEEAAHGDAQQADGEPADAETAAPEEDASGGNGGGRKRPS